MNIVLRNYINAAYSEMYPIRVDYEWRTDVSKSDTGKEQRNQIFVQPIRHWLINWNVLKQAGRNKLIEIFHRARGKYDTFLLSHRDDYACAVTDWAHTATAGEASTQLQKTYFKGESEEWSEDKKDIVPGTTYAPTVTLDAVPKTEDTHFTLDDSTGLIDWTGGSAPNGAMAGGEVVRADYQFYFRVRFEVDRYSDIRFLPDRWRAKGVAIVEVRS